MAATYVLESRTKSGNFLATLPYRNLQGEFWRNKADQIRFEVPLSHQAITRSTFYPAQHEIWGYRNGIKIFAGPLWDVTASSDNKVLSCSAEGLESYLEGRRLDAPVTYTNSYRESIINDLVINKAQTGTNASLGLTWGLDYAQTFDSFYRVADSATTLGTLDSGQTWTYQEGVWGIENRNFAYNVSQTHGPTEDYGSFALVNIGSGNMQLEVTIRGMYNTSPAPAGLAGRWVSNTLCYVCDYDLVSHTVRIRYRNGSSFTTLASSTTYNWVDGDRLKFTLTEQVGETGVTLQGLVNDVVKVTTSHTAAGRPSQSQGIAGLYQDFGTGVNPPGARFDNFSGSSDTASPRSPLIPSLTYYMGDNIYELVESLSKGTLGFDWEITPDRQFRLYYPRRAYPSQRAGALIYPDNIKRYSIQYQGKYEANDILVIGADGINSTPGAYIDSVARSTYGLRQLTETATDLETQSQVDDYAAYLLKVHKNVKEIPQVSLNTDIVNPFNGDIWFGNTANVIINDGWVQYSQTMRLTGFQVTSGKQGNETFVLYMSDLREV